MPLIRGRQLGSGEPPLGPGGGHGLGEGPEISPQGHSPLTFYRIKGMSGWGRKAPGQAGPEGPRSEEGPGLGVLAPR